MSAIPSWAVRGAKVVCIDNRWPEDTWYGAEVMPSLDTPYTIRAVRQHVGGEFGLLLAEIRNPVLYYADGAREAFFHIKRFRPLITQQDDIETHFKALLDVPEQVGV